VPRADGELRTFKLRRGRITPGQRHALDTLWRRYGVDLGTGRFDPATVYGRRAPLVVEIGFGMGEATVAMAAADPDRDVLAVDVHTPGAGALLRDVAAAGLVNVRVVLGDGRDVLRLLTPGTLDELRVFFPDPWPKTRHHKRRLVEPGFVRLAASRLRVGGRLHCATDHRPYAERMLSLLAAEPSLANDGGGGVVDGDGYAERPAWRPVTRFERRALDGGHEVFDVIATRAPGHGASAGDRG